MSEKHARRTHEKRHDHHVVKDSIWNRVGDHA